MSTIARLRDQLDAAREQLEAMARDPLPRFSSELARTSLEHHVKALEREVRLALESRRVEVLTVRLDGPGLRQGSIRLGLLSAIGRHVSSAIQAGVQRRRTGRRVARLSPEIADFLDLRLAGIGAGSTTLHITGATAPDLFGLSDLEAVLHDTFSLLEATERDARGEAVSAVGVRTAREVSQLASLLANATASLELTWSPPSDVRREWKGSSVELGALAEALGRFEEREPEEIDFSGTVMTLSSRGRFEIDLGGRILSGTFPSRLQSTIRRFRIGDLVVGRVQRTTVINVATDRVKVANVLLQLAPAGQDEFEALEDGSE